MFRRYFLPIFDRFCPSARMGRSALFLTSLTLTTCSLLLTPHSSYSQAIASDKIDKLTQEIKTNLAANNAKKAPSGSIQTKILKGKIELTFRWQRETAAAAFTHGKHSWLIFNRPLSKKNSTLAKKLPSYFKKATIINGKTFGALRMESHLPLYIASHKVNNSTNWKFTISKRYLLKQTSLDIAINNHSKQAPYVTIQTQKATPSIRIKDPETQEIFLIVPTLDNAGGIFPERRFIDFQLFSSAQGIAALLHSPETHAKIGKTDVRFLSQKGLTLSKALPDIAETQSITHSKSLDTLFPYKRWKTNGYKDFIKQKIYLEGRITALDKQNSLLPQMRLAELYLSEGMHAEAIGMLDRIAEQNEAFYNEYLLAALHGAANFMMYRFEESALDFSDDSLKGIDEIRVWQSVLNILLGSSGSETSPTTLDFNRYDKQYIRHYPPDMRRRIAIVAADNSIAEGKALEAKKIIDRLKEDKQLGNMEEYSHYIMGRVYIAEGDIEKARDYLSPLANDSDDRFVRAHAAFTLYTALFQNREINREEFIKALNKTRILWRGDMLELNLLYILGELYIAQEDFVGGLRVWKEILTYYPGTDEAMDVGAKMAARFLQLFNEGKAEELEPIEALALYYEFRELTPIGEAGDQMIRNLADRLAAVDLLDRASALLSHQVKYRLEGEQRSKVGARLALLHLLNRKPSEAIETLQLTGFGNNTANLQRKRNHLAAQAYADAGNYTSALSAIEGDFSNEAKELRLDIHWKEKDWTQVIQKSEAILSGRKDLAAALTVSEEKALLRLAIAYTFEHNHEQLQYLRDYFTGLLAPNSGIKNSFLFITNDNGPIDRDNLSKLSEDVGGITSFLKSYRKKVKDSGLSSTMNPDAQTQ